MIDLTPIFQGLLALAVTVVSVLILPYIKTKTTVSQRQELCSWVAIAVAAAEQVYTGSGRGPEKKAYVLDWLKKKGFTVDADTLDALIESAVYQLKEAV